MSKNFVEMDIKNWGDSFLFYSSNYEVKDGVYYLISGRPDKCFFVHRGGYGHMGLIFGDYWF